MPYPIEPAVNSGAVPDLFLPPGGGRRVTEPADWPAAAARWRALIVEREYGGLPPAPEAVEIETLCHSRVRRWEGAPLLFSYRVHCLGGERPITLGVRILAPDVPEPVPAIMAGDGCWWYCPDEVAQAIVRRGCALVTFNRTEMAEDRATALRARSFPDGEPPDDARGWRCGGLYDVYPGRQFGALAAWAWGYHRCVDLLCSLPFIDASRLAVTGHSRGGKTALLAGATDDRITLVNDNAGGCGGSALFRYVGEGGETLSIVKAIATWFGADNELAAFIGREGELPFDQHALLAAVAPRPLLLTYALDDRWSNPEGMVLSARAAGTVYDWLGRRDALAFHLRPGGHTHSSEDWDTLLDFIDWQWRGQAPVRDFNRHPYAHLDGHGRAL